jgi:DNA sulfur modification protein DndC
LSNNFLDNNSIDVILDELKRVYLNDNRPWILGYSGGKDSTTVLLLVFNMLLSLPKEQRHKNVYVVSSDTLVENPIILEYLKKNINLINSSAKSNDINLSAHLVQPRINNTFWVNVIGRGFPTPKSKKFRWCTERLKIQPSNDFILETIEKSGEVVILLGVRKAESEARRQRIEARKIDGYLLTPHETINGAYVYNPIEDLTTDDVWNILLNYYKKTPWGTDNSELFKLYSDSDGGECPFVLTTRQSDKNIEIPSCGQTRFGCWICTVVQEDKSLNGFIKNGEEWLIPLAEFREWILNIRDNPEYREKHRRDGTVYKTKTGETGFGPFTFKARQEILRKLLETQKEVGYELITIDELKEIDKIWDEEEDLTRSILINLYKEVMETKLPWHDFKSPLYGDDVIDYIYKYANNYDIPEKLIKTLLIQTEKFKHYSNKNQYKTVIRKILNQKWLHQDLDEEIEYDSY